MDLSLPRVIAVSAVVALVVSCGKDNAASAPAPRGPVEVGVITVQPRAVTLTKELPGRTSAFRVAEVRARVNGIVLKRLFEEGADVKAGQALFKIDPAPYQAAYDTAAAQLQRAEANVASARSLAERFGKLIDSNAISRQEHDDAVARLRAAEADVAAAKAQVKAARINLDYTTVTSPLAGRIGRAEVTEGAYVQAQGATLLATVQQLDRVYVDMTWSSADALRLRQARDAGKVETSADETRVTIVLETGRVYETPGTLQFADVTVDASTGSISLRAIVPNPKGELLPGMFVRARIDEGVDPAGILVEQRGVTRDQNGRPVALVVGADNKVERRQLATERSVGDAWLVTSGLSAGDRVIVEGLQKVRPGVEVKVVPTQPAGKASAARAAP